MTWDGTDGVNARLFSTAVNICGECHNSGTVAPSGQAPNLSDFATAVTEIDRVLIRIEADTMPPSNATNFPLDLPANLRTLVSTWAVDLDTADPRTNAPPSVTTNPATAIGKNTATLNADVNDNGIEANYSFAYGIGNFSSSATAADSPATSGGGLITDTVTTVVTGLSCGSNYQFRIQGSNTTGPSNGNSRFFSTTACPTANAQSISLDEDTSRAITLTANNDDSVSVFTVESDPVNGT
ncbi:MAG: hypothetical protein HKM98_10320, partial [Gammaproteobacteria bacterium]|nr:hypothetical protein [Gammaproteobacteria bacterium]